MNSGAGHIHFSASILSADFADLAGAVREAEKAGADSIHVDIMDGHYVHNFTFGIPTVSALKQRTRLPLHVHLEIEHPESYIVDFARAGADLVLVQADTCRDLACCLADIRRTGVGVGLALNPETPLAVAEPCLRDVDLLLIFAVHPGFGGQPFQEHVLDKVRQARQLVESWVHPPLIGVDGGVNLHTAATCVSAGANLLAMGSAVYGGPFTVAENIHQLRAAVRSDR